MKDPDRRRFHGPRLALVTALLVAGCAAPPTRALPELSFQHLDRRPVPVAAVAVDNQYVPPLSSEHVEYRLTQTPASVFRTWAYRRLVPSAEDGRLLATIREASIVERDRGAGASTGGALRDLFTVNQDRELRGRLVVTFAFVWAGRSVSYELDAERARTLAENVTLAEREAAQLALIEALIEDIDAALLARLEEEPPGPQG